MPNKISVEQKIPIAFLAIDMAGSTKASAEEKRTFRRTVTRTVENFDGTILQWHGDGTVAFFDSNENPEESAVLSGKQIMENLFVNGLSAHLAVGSDIVPDQADRGTLDSNGLNRCGHLRGIAPPHALLITEEAYDSLPEPLQNKSPYLGTTRRDGIGSYIFPKTAKVSDFEKDFVSHEEDIGLQRRDYLKFLKERNSHLTYVGIRQIRKLPGLKLMEVFEPLEVRKISSWNAEFYEEEIPRIEEKGSAIREMKRVSEYLRRGSVEEPPQPFLTAFREKNHLVVLGDPGSGKSTLLKWLALIYAGGMKKIWLKLELSKPLLPILVSLGELVKCRKENKIGSFPKLLSDLTLNLHCERLFEAVLAQGNGLLLLDGLDEISDPIDRLEMARYLDSAMISFGQNRFVITSRIAGYNEICFPEKEVYKLLPFGNAQRERFLKVWCVAYEKSVTEDGQEAQRKGEENARELILAIKSHPKICDLTTNPFLLSIAAIVHRQGRILPRYRVELYQLIAKTLIETWDMVRSIGITPILPKVIDYQREAREILYPLGLWMHNTFPTGVAPEDELKSFLIDRMMKGGRILEDEALQSVEKLFEELRTRTHLLVEKGPNRWGFLHLALQEYLAAVSLVSSDSYLKEIRKHPYDPRWQEVILLIAGEIGINQGRGKAVTEMIKAISSGIAGDKLNEEILQKHILLAGRSIGEIGGIEDEIVEKEIVKKLIAFALYSNYNKLRDEAISVLIAFHDTPSYEKILGSLLDALKDEDLYVRIRAAEVLAQLGSTDPRVLNALLDALKDEDLYVRIRAAEALAQLGSTDPRVFNTLLDALKDKNVYVRINAAVALGQLGSTDPRVFNTLLDALKGENKWISNAGFNLLWALSERNVNPEVVG